MDPLSTNINRQSSANQLPAKPQDTQVQTLEVTSSAKQEQPPVPNVVKTEQQSASSVKQAQTNVAEQKAIAVELNKQFQAVERNLVFDVVKEPGAEAQVVVSVIDKETGETIRKIPSEEALRLAERMKSLSESHTDKTLKSQNDGLGLFINKKE